MKIEILKPDEYRQLEAIADSFVPPKKNSVVWVARNDAGEIVGRTMILFLPHIEGTWVRPDHRGSTVAYRLLQTVEDAAAKAGAREVFAYAGEKQVEDYLARIGYKEAPLKLLKKAVK